MKKQLDIKPAVVGHANGHLAGFAHTDDDQPGVQKQELTINDAALPVHKYLNADGTQPSQLNDAGRRELKACESVIAKGLRSFVAVGNALLSIRRKKLYQDTHGSFEDYCRNRWNMARSRAYKVMDGAQVMGMMESMDQAVPRPACEAQVRPLARLGKKDVVEIWQNAVADARHGKVTARLVAKKVQAWRVARGEILVKPPTPAMPAVITRVTASAMLQRVQCALEACQTGQANKAITCLKAVQTQLIELGACAAFAARNESANEPDEPM